MKDSHLRLVVDSTASGAEQTRLVPTGVLDSNGREFYVTSDGTSGGGSGSGGGSPPPPDEHNKPMKALWHLDIPRDVQIAKWGFAFLLAAFGTAFVYFIDEFKDVRKDLSIIQSTVSAQSVKVDGIDRSLTRIEEKLDNSNKKSEK
jgi:hypothetical protein